MWWANDCPVWLPKSNTVLGCIKKLAGGGEKEMWVPEHTMLLLLNPYSWPDPTPFFPPCLLIMVAIGCKTTHLIHLWFSLLLHSCVQAINSLWCHSEFSSFLPFLLLWHHLNNSLCLSLVTISKCMRLETTYNSSISFFWEHPQPFLRDTMCSFSGFVMKFYFRW